MERTNVSDQERRPRKDLSLANKRKRYRANKFYDDHMAGRWNHEEKGFNVSLNQTSKKKVESKPKGSEQCSGCGNLVPVKNLTVSYICSSCGFYNKVG